MTASAVPPGKDKTNLETFLLYSDQASKLLEQAEVTIQNQHESDAKGRQYAVPGKIYHFDDAASSSSHADGQSDYSTPSSSSSSSEAASLSNDNEDEINNTGTSETSLPSIAADASRKIPSKGDAEEINAKATASEPPQKPKHSNENRKTKNSKKMRDNTQLIHQQLTAASAAVFPVEDDAEIVLPMSLLPKSLRVQGIDLTDQCSSFRKLSVSLQSQNVVVLLVRSGRFAGGVFKRNKCIVHRACQRYTIRRGQGKSQSAQDNSKRKAKSMGAQLRRAGEVALREDIHETLQQWKSHIQSACLVLLSCPKTMISYVFADAVKDVIARDDERIRKVPFDIGRPTYESVCVTHNVLLHMGKRARTVLPSEILTTDGGGADYTTDTTSLEKAGSDDHAKDEGSTDADKQKQDKKPDIPYTPLHEAVLSGDHEKLLEWLSVESMVKQIDVQAGPDLSTALHIASESKGIDAVDGAKCVLALLREGKADPCILDIRGRPPYFLASHDKIREAFRIARGSLGEGYCDWNASKVGAALTEDAIQAKKEKEAEKRRQKRARQKQKKAAEKAKAEEAERVRKEQEEKRKIHLNSLGTGTRVGCHWCNGDISRKPRKSLFFLHDFKFCSSDCVKNHKRAQAANAALARLGL